MDAVDLVLALLTASLLANIVLLPLCARLWYIGHVAQQESIRLARLVAQSRPRSPQQQPYATGLVDPPYVDILA